MIFFCTNSQGTVEERIVQRAQKKLFLDCMVNRGSTAQGQEIDRKLLAARQARLSAGAGMKSEVIPIHTGGSSSSEDSYWPDVPELETEHAAMETGDAQVKDEAEEEGEEEGADSTSAKPTTTTTSTTNNSKASTKSAELQAAEELDATTVMSALKFGWNACFGGSDGQGDAVSISDAALDAIIDRTRTCDSKVTQLLDAGAAGAKGKGNNNNKGSANVKTEGASSLGLQEGQQSSVTAFEEAAPLVDLRQFEGQTVQKKQPVRFFFVLSCYVPACGSTMGCRLYLCNLFHQFLLFCRCIYSTERHPERHFQSVDPAVLLSAASVPSGTSARRQRGPGECAKSQQLHPRTGRVLDLREGGAAPQAMGLWRRQ